MMRFVWLLLLPPLAGSAAEPELGRLLLSPEQRLALERQRRLAAPPGEPLRQLPVWTLNGVVRRSQGPGTRWINGQPDGSATPLPPALAVGDTWNNAQASRHPLLGEGQLRVHPPSGNSAR